MVCPGVRDDDEAGLLELPCDIVGEVTRGEAACDGLCAGAGSEFEHGALSVGTCADDTDVVGVLDCGNDAGCENEFFPGLADVDYVDACCFIVYIYE